MKFAIVDIETTGGYAAGAGITEISIQVLENGKVTERYETLVNPVYTIPPYIEALTGITNEMVRRSPLFDEIAGKIYQLLQDKIFVAHSVNFDYSFIKNQLKSCGYEFNAPKLCTVRLSRKLLPGHASYSLSKLCHALGITHINRHRAGGDTDATVALFQLLCATDKDGYILKCLQRSSHEQSLPPNVPREDFERLPYTPGVYYFHDEKGKVVYVGKAKNIRYRVSSHFGSNSPSRQRQNFMRYVYRITYEAYGTELMAAVKESSAIKKLWPRFNASQKRREQLYCILSYEDQNGYLRLVVDTLKNNSNALATYHHLENAKANLRQLVHEFDLCPRLCFLNNNIYDDKTHRLLCKGACVGKEDFLAYNNKVNLAIQKLKQLPSFAIIDAGLNNDQSCILVLQGRFYGMGYIPNGHQMNSPEEMMQVLEPYKENITINHLLFSYARRYPAKIMHFNEQQV